MTKEELDAIAERATLARVGAGIASIGEDKRVSVGGVYALLDDLDALIAEVRRLTRPASWLDGVEDYAGCTTLTDVKTGEVIGWYNEKGWGECKFGPVGLLSDQCKTRITEYAKAAGYEVQS